MTRRKAEDEDPEGGGRGQRGRASPVHQHHRQPDRDRRIHPEQQRLRAQPPTADRDLEPALLRGERQHAPQHLMLLGLAELQADANVFGEAFGHLHVDQIGRHDQHAHAHEARDRAGARAEPARWIDRERQPHGRGGHQAQVVPQQEGHHRPRGKRPESSPRVAPDVARHQPQRHRRHQQLGVAVQTRVRRRHQQARGETGGDRSRHAGGRRTGEAGGQRSPSRCRARPPRKIPARPVARAPTVPRPAACPVRRNPGRASRRRAAAGSTPRA